jgi:hypothetical protein
MKKRPEDMTHAELLEAYYWKIQQVEEWSTKYYKLHNHVVESTIPELKLSMHALNRAEPKTMIAIHKIDVELEYLYDKT